MINSILGSKQKMSQTFVEGIRVPVTKVTAGPCDVTQIKNKDKDGYNAIQVGFGQKKTKNITKPLLGHMKGAFEKDAKVAPRFLREIRLEKESEYKVGDQIKVSDLFVVGDKISV